jgi:hypothetical protein
MNFFLDRDAALRNADLAALRQKTGACAPASPAIGDGALSGTFEFICERGTLKVNIILAPTATPTLQKLEFTQ